MHRNIKSLLIDIKIKFQVDPSEMFVSKDVQIHKEMWLQWTQDFAEELLMSLREFSSSVLAWQPAAAVPAVRKRACHSLSGADQA